MLEQKVENINRIIKQSSEIIVSGNVPDLNILENEIVDFVTQLKSLSGADAKQYIDIVKIWTDQLQSFQETLIKSKAKIQSEIGQLHTQGKANNAYTKASGNN
jgi:hypothetical protein